MFIYWIYNTLCYTYTVLYTVSLQYIINILKIDMQYMAYRYIAIYGTGSDR